MSHTIGAVSDEGAITIANTTTLPMLEWKTDDGIEKIGYKLI